MTDMPPGGPPNRVLPPVRTLPQTPREAAAGAARTRFGASVGLPDGVRPSGISEGFQQPALSAPRAPSGDLQEALDAAGYGAVQEALAVPEVSEDPEDRTFTLGELVGRVTSQQRARRQVIEHGDPDGEDLASYDPQDILGSRGGTDESAAPAIPRRKTDSVSLAGLALGRINKPR